jgi:hypothetical protein
MKIVEYRIPLLSNFESLFAELQSQDQILLVTYFNKNLRYSLTPRQAQADPGAPHEQGICGLVVREAVKALVCVPYSIPFNHTIVTISAAIPSKKDATSSENT